MEILEDITDNQGFIYTLKGCTKSGRNMCYSLRVYDTEVCEEYKKEVKELCKKHFQEHLDLLSKYEGNNDDI